MTDLAPAPIPVTTDDGDHERFAHIVRKGDDLAGYVLGQTITALCGKTWVPSRDPERYPVCPDCVRVRDARRGGA